VVDRVLLEKTLRVCSAHVEVAVVVLVCGDGELTIIAVRVLGPSQARAGHTTCRPKLATIVVESSNKPLFCDSLIPYRQQTI
jgi:hypothetical protein